MPADDIDRAIRKGTGELPGVVFEEITYEGYGPGGVAMMVKVTTDNKNRAASDVRSIFTRFGGHLTPWKSSTTSNRCFPTRKWTIR